MRPGNTCTRCSGLWSGPSTSWLWGRPSYWSGWPGASCGGRRPEIGPAPRPLDGARPGGQSTLRGLRARKSGGVLTVIAATELRAGMVVDLEGVRYRVMAAETHLGGGKVGAMVHARLARLDTGSMTERRFRPDEKLADQPLDQRELDFLYQDGDDFIFMDPKSFDQMPLPRALLGSFAPFLREGVRLQVD